MRVNIICFAGLCWGFGVFLSEDVSAAESPQAGNIEEVVVTARRREENLQDVPISVSVLSADDIERFSMRSTMDIDQQIPNFRFDNTATTLNARLFVRGVGQRGASFRQDPRVGVYLDGMYVPRPSGAILDLLDIASIQVLRGPQGTLFGKNTTGGAVLVESTLPTSGEFDARVKVEAGSFDLFSGQAIVDIPIVKEWLAARIAVRHQELDGWEKDVITGDKANADDTRSYRVSISAFPSDEFEFTLTGESFRQRGTASGGQCLWRPTLTSFITRLEPDNPDEVAEIRAGCQLSEGLPNDKTALSQLQDLRKDTKAVSGRLTWDLGPLTLKSVTSWRELDGSVNVDFDGGASAILDDIDADTNTYKSQELQIAGSAIDDRFDWLVGFFFDKEDGEEFAGGTRCIAPQLLGPCLPQNAEAPTFADFESWAAFTDATFAVTEHISITAGVRYTEDTKEISTYSVQPDLITPVSGSFTSRKADFSAATPHVSTTYQFNDDLMAYAGWSRGFTSGGFNAASANLLPFDEETIDAYELGMKSSWLDRRVTLNAALFYSDFQDQQVIVTSLNRETGNIQQLVSNAAASTIRGGEIEVAATLAEGWTINAGFGYTDASYDKFDAVIQLGTGPGGELITGIEDLSDGNFEHVPKWSFNASVAYETAVGSFGQLRSQLDWIQEADSFNDPQNDPEAKTDSYGLLNGRINLLFPNEKTELSLWGRNLTDKQYVREGEGIRTALNIVIRKWSPPRSVGVTLQHRFGA